VGLVAAPARAEGPVFEHESEPIDLILDDSIELFNASEFDTGWVPADSPLQVRFQIVSEGGASVEMEGVARLGWPEGLTLSLEPTPGTGEIIVDAALSAVTSVKFNVLDYSWDSEIDRRTLDIEGEGFFDPFLLGGDIPSSVSVVFEGSRNELINWGFTVFTGVRAEFTVDIGPQATTEFAGANWYVDTERVSVAGQTALLEPQGAAYQLVDTEFVGDWDSRLDLVLNPVFSVCVDIVGCWDLVDIDIPIPLAADVVEQRFPLQQLAFPLPMLNPPDAVWDFGEVEIGTVHNLQLPLENIGQLDLEGIATLTGSTYFTSYPTTFQAAPGVVDGVVVTFSPEAVGEFSGTLLLESNDPNNPVVEIQIIGDAYDPAAPGGTDGGDGGGRDAADPTVITTEVKGCRCSSAEAPAGGLWSGLVALLGVGLARRRGRGAGRAR
jgi:hypothetical protein